MTKDFDVNGICRIIKVCSENGVKQFALGRLRIDFGQVVQAPSLEPVFISEAIERATESQARESLQKDEIRQKEFELEQMVIEDPARFEELLMAGDLKDEEA